MDASRLARLDLQIIYGSCDLAEDALMKKLEGYDYLFIGHADELFVEALWQPIYQTERNLAKRVFKVDRQDVAFIFAQSSSSCTRARIFLTQFLAS